MLEVVLRTFRRDTAGRPVRVAATAWLVIQLVVVLVIIWHWTDAGVDGILSQHATPDAFTITQLRPGAAADLAGLKDGDRIVARDGIPASDRQAYWALRRTGHADQAVVLSVIRNGHPGGDALQQQSGGLEQVRLNLTPSLSIPDQLALLSVLALFNVLSPAMALIVLWARPRDQPARLFALGALVFAPYSLLYMWDKAVGYTVDPQWHWYVAHLFGRALLLVWLHLFLSFPVRQPWFGGRVAIGLLYVVPLGLSVINFATYFPEPLAFWALQTPAADALDRDSAVGVVLWALLVLALIAGYRRAPRPAARGTITWLMFSVGLGIALLILSNNTFNALIGFSVQPVSDVARWAAVLVEFSAVALALARYRLFEVSPFVRTALIYPLVFGILFGGYDLLANALGRLATDLLGAELSTNPLLAALPLVVAVALLRPLRRQLQGLLERSLYRASRSRTDLLEEAVTELVRPRPVEVIATFLTVRAAERMNLSGAWLAVREPLVGVPPPPAPAEPLLDHIGGTGEPLVLVHGSQEQRSVTGDALTLVAEDEWLAGWYVAGARLVIPLQGAAMAGEDRAPPIGAWVIGQRRSGEPFDEADLAALTHVGGLAAFQLEYTRLAATVALQHQGGIPLAH